MKIEGGYRSGVMLCMMRGPDAFSMDAVGLCGTMRMMRVGDASGPGDQIEVSGSS
jgi:hypothetical protein